MVDALWVGMLAAYVCRSNASEETGFPGLTVPRSREYIHLFKVPRPV
jgi:hypothetical protein